MKNPMAQHELVLVCLLNDGYECGVGATAYNVSKQLGISRNRARSLLNELLTMGFVERTITVHRRLKAGKVDKHNFWINSPGLMYLHIRHIVTFNSPERLLYAIDSRKGEVSNVA